MTNVSIERIIVFIPHDRSDIFDEAIIHNNGSEKGYHQKGAFKVNRSET